MERVDRVPGQWEEMAVLASTSTLLIVRRWVKWVRSHPEGRVVMSD